MPAGQRGPQPRAERLLKGASRRTALRLLIDGRPYKQISATLRSKHSISLTPASLRSWAIRNADIIRQITTDELRLVLRRGVALKSRRIEALINHYHQVNSIIAGFRVPTPPTHYVPDDEVALDQTVESPALGDPDAALGISANYILGDDLPKYMRERRQILEQIRIETEPFQNADDALTEQQRQTIQQRDLETQAAIAEIRQRIGNLTPEVHLVLVNALARHQALPGTSCAHEPIEGETGETTGHVIPTDHQLPEALTAVMPHIAPLKGQVVREATQHDQSEDSTQDSPDEEEAS